MNFRSWLPEDDELMRSIGSWVPEEAKPPVKISKKPIPRFYVFEIKKVIFNPPATIVLWKDGTKTVVKCGEYDVFDAEKGLAMAFAKKALGNKGSYYNVINKWVETWEESIADKVVNAMKRLKKAYRSLGGTERS